jgi:hypothetical protein
MPDAFVRESLLQEQAKDSVSYLRAALHDPNRRAGLVPHTRESSHLLT